MQPLSSRLSLTDPRPWPDHPVRIALTITELDVGGAENALVSLATRLDRRLWSPSVIALGPEAPLAVPLRAAGLPVTCLSVRKSRPLHALRLLARALRATQPALVQSFLFHANLLTRFAALSAGRPWVLGGIRVAEHLHRWHLWLDRLSIPLVCAEVCVSPGVLRFSQQVAHLPANRLTVIPNSVDPDPFDRASPTPRTALNIPDSAFLTLFVGRLTRQKGVFDLLSAADTVASARPDWHLALVGDGPQCSSLLARAQSLAHPDRIHFLGRRSDVPSLLKSANLLVLPSLWEGMPNVILEAMAAGLPVVATSVEGSEDLVQPHHTGWLVPPASPSALASALLDAASDPARLRLFGSAARARAASDFSPARVVSAYEHLWARVLNLSYPHPLSTINSPAHP